MTGVFLPSHCADPPGLDGRRNIEGAAGHEAAVNVACHEAGSERNAGGEAVTSTHDVDAIRSFALVS